MAGPVPPTPSLPTGRSAADRLDSWKEIAAHLKRDVRTVQRWEKDHALPVQRHVNAKQGSVFGYKDELDAWWNDRRGELELQSVLPRRTVLRRLARSDAAWTIAAGAVIVAVALAMVKKGTPPVPVSMVGLSVVLGTDLFLDTSPGGSMLALSPDGSQLAFIGRSRGRVRLFLRRLDRFESRVLPGTDNAISPFFSPDGHWVGFFAIDGIKRIAIDGDTPPEFVSRVPEPEGGAVWQPDDTIIFATGTGGLMRVSARGGTPQPLTHVDVQHHEYMHRDPAVLPGGRTVLFTVWSPEKTGEHFRIDAQSLESGDRRTILADGALRAYVPGVGLIFARGGRVMATRFDPRRLETTGDPVPAMEVADDMALTPDGMVAYTPGALTVPERTLVWVDHEGREQPVGAPPRAYGNPSLSPDGRRIATAISDESHGEVWIYDLGRSALTPLTSEGGNGLPFWTPDGARVVFSSPRNGTYALRSQAIDRSGPAELLNPECGCAGASFNRDGQLLFCSRVGTALTSDDIWVVSGAGRGNAKPLVQVPFIQGGPRVSPDDHWLAYVSDESGRWEVYITELPGAHHKWQVSTEGGGEPMWSRDGRTLFFRASGKVMSVAIESPASPHVMEHPPIALFQDSYVPGEPLHPNYDVSADGSHLLMIKGERPDRISEIRVLQGWKTKVASLLQ